MPSGFTYLRKALKGSRGVGWRWVVRPVLKDDIYSARAFGGYANTGHDLDRIITSKESLNHLENKHIIGTSSRVAIYSK